MLLIFQPVNDEVIPMTFINVHTGEPLLHLSYKTPSIASIEFLEQFNERILVKIRGQPLRIHDVLSPESSTKKVPNFVQSPDAFIFIYERDLFVSLSSLGRLALWSIEGDLLNE
jgi:hypothetical protein